MALLKTSNPALSADTFRLAPAVAGESMTISGAVNKTGILLILAMLTAAVDGAKLGPDLFVEEAIGNQGENFAFARREAFKASLEEPQFGQSSFRLTAEVDRSRDGFQ